MSEEHIQTRVHISIIIENLRKNYLVLYILTRLQSIGHPYAVNLAVNFDGIGSLVYYILVIQL